MEYGLVGVLDVFQIEARSSDGCREDMATIHSNHDCGAVLWKMVISVRLFGGGSRGISLFLPL